jgi:hypothetical protein
MKTKAFWLLLLLLVGLLFPRSLHSQSASTLSFSRHDLSLGGNPLGVASADFNGDGKQDLAVLFEPSGATRTFVAMFLGNGDGTFTLLNTFDTGFAAPWLITADLNHDNKPDLVIANGFGRSISVFLGNGDGTFGTSNVIPLPGRIESVIAADFNGDGKLDIAAPDFEFAPQPSVSILLGNGDGTFGQNTEYPTLDTPFVVITDDFNHDGKLDLALNTDLGTVSVIGSVLLGNGNGTFQPKKDFGTGFTQSADLASGDFNADGKTDLVVANNADDSVSILLGNGDGTFTLQSSIALPVTPFRVVARDIDADGKLDLVVARRNSATVSILIGKGDGTFGAPIDFGVGAGPQFIAVTDLNGDGLVDIVTPNEDDGTVSILLNTTAQALTAACTVNGSMAPVTVLVTSFVAYNANPNPASASTCDWNPGTPLPGAFDTAAGSSCAPSSPIYTAIAGGTFSESVTVTNGSNVVTSSCPALTVQDFSLSVTPPSATVLPGGGVAYSVTASSINGFTGQINFVQSTTLPSAVSAAWNPTSQSCIVPASGSCSATYTVTVGAGASAADIGLVFHGTYSPVLTTRDASATLHISPAPAPVITSISPLSGNQGQTVMLTVIGSNFLPGATLYLTGTGPVPVLSSPLTCNVPCTSATATIVIPANAIIQLKDVVATNPGSPPSQPLTKAFRVDAELLVFSGALNEAADEPSLAVDPSDPTHSHLVVGFNVLTKDKKGNWTFDHGRCGWAESFDGGHSWKSGSVQFPTPFQPTGDPWVRYSRSGQLFYSCMGSTGSGSGSAIGIFMWISQSGPTNNLTPSGIAANLNTRPPRNVRVVRCTSEPCTVTDEPTFDILENSPKPRIVACWLESQPSKDPALKIFSNLNTAFSDGGTIWSNPTVLFPDPANPSEAGQKAFAGRVGVGPDATVNVPRTIAVSWLSKSDDNLYIRTSSDGKAFDSKTLLAAKFEPLLRYGSTTGTVLSQAYAALVPGQDSLLAVAQARFFDDLSVTFVNTTDPSAAVQRKFIGDTSIEKFLPSAGHCGRIAGMYQVTAPGPTPAGTLFRYTAWSLDNWSTGALGPVFVSGADSASSFGFPDSHFIYPRIGEYTAVDCSGSIAWVSWTDLRNHKPEIWVALSPLP